MRKITVITGSRAEYGLMRSVLDAINNHPKLKLSLIVTGIHLSKRFGYTVKEIEKDGYPIAAKVNSLVDEDTGMAMARSVGKTTERIAEELYRIKPDILFVLCDLGWALAGAVAGSYMNIPIAHIHGGEITGGGTVDENVRHAITKLSHIHFVSTKEYGERIIKMGEDQWRVHVVGAPGLDVILNRKLPEPKVLAKKYNLSLKEPIVLAVQHSVIAEANRAGNQMKETMEALKELRYQTIVIYPNADAGGRRIIKVIEQYRKYPFLRIFKSLPHDDYLGLMNMADVMVGNSSSGIIEAPSFHLPVVNIGTRQEGRVRGKNVIDVDYKKSEIVKGILTALTNEKFKRQVQKCENPYGDGKAGKRIVDILSKVKITSHLLQKQITY